MQLTAKLLLALIVVPAAAVNLRRADPPAEPAEIAAKWSKMDEFLNVMFSMACKWKHGKDVYGAAAEKLKNGEVDGAAGYAKEVKDLQARNVKGLIRACGEIVGDSKQRCRQDCATRWNEMAVKRDECDEKCVKLYAGFEASCEAKADGLVSVYEQKSAKSAGQKQCYEGHCKEFPMVWMKDDAAKMEAAVTEECDKKCTDKNIKVGCQHQWAVEIDFVTAEVASKCAEESGTSTCFKTKKADTSAAYDTCKTDTEKTCGDAYTECQTKGKTDNTFKDAEAFCKDRKKMCLEQANKKCLSKNEAALDKAEADCKKEGGAALETCQEEKLGEKETAAEEKCIAENGPKCKGKCQKKCEVTKMNDCLATLSGGPDPGKMFCNDMWDMLHAKSEVDPVTGDPAPAF